MEEIYNKLLDLLLRQRQELVDLIAEAYKAGLADSKKIHDEVWDKLKV